MYFSKFRRNFTFLKFVKCNSQRTEKMHRRKFSEFISKRFLRNCSTKRLERTAPRPPAPFVVFHKERSSLFEVMGKSVTGEKIIAHAQLPTYESRRASNGVPQPALWSACVTRGTFSMDLTCSTLEPGTLSIDGLAFYNDASECCEHSLEAHRNRRSTYQGPLFHNGNLASLALGIPVADTIHPHRQSARNWYNPYQGTLTKYTKYDHMPVHTIDPELYEAAAQYVHELGLTDDFAMFMKAYLDFLVEVETERWCRDILEITEVKTPKKEGAKEGEL